MWEIVLLALLGGALMHGSLRQSHRLLRPWRKAAASCGLQGVEISGWTAWNGLRLKARAGPVEVRFEQSGRKEEDTRIVIVIPGPPEFHKVKIRPELLLQWGREIEIGDEAFDSVFFIEGPARLVCALLDAETRRLLIRLNAESRLEMLIGTLQAEMSETKIPDLLPLLLDVGQRLAQPMYAPRRLVENATRDPEAGVRLQNLLLLIHRHPGETETVEALRAACSDSSPEIRLRAARELGAEGRDVLLELAEGAADDALSAQAVSLLKRDLPFESANSILLHALRRRRLRTAHICLDVLGRSGAAAAVDTLATVMAREEGELAAAAAQALGTTGSPAAEPPLILALQREPPDLQVAAANALGRFGSPAAVLPLKELAERSPRDPEILRATRQAIAEIQSRVPGASPGQLSLAGAEVGQLSLAQAEAGQLSLANDAAGQLSLPPGEPGQLSLGDAEEGPKPASGGAA